MKPIREWMGSTLIVLGPVVERRVSLGPVALFLIGEVLLVDLALVNTDAVLWPLLAVIPGTR